MTSRFSGRFLTPPHRHTASIKVRPLKYDVTSFLPPKNSRFKRNMFRINLCLIVVGLRVEGQNNYMRRRWKGESMGGDLAPNLGGPKIFFAAQFFLVIDLVLRIFPFFSHIFRMFTT